MQRVAVILFVTFIQLSVTYTPTVVWAQDATLYEPSPSANPVPSEQPKPEITGSEPTDINVKKALSESLPPPAEESAPPPSKDTPPIVASQTSPFAMGTQPLGAFKRPLVVAGGNFQTKNSNLKSIRFQKHKDFYRFVLDFDSVQAPWCFVSVEDSLTIECNGVRKTLKKSGWSKPIQKYQIFEAIRPPSIVEGNQLTLSWKLGKPASQMSAQAFHLESPGRLVVDLKMEATPSENPPSIP